MIDPKRHADQRNWLEAILHQVPGFQGYLEAEYRREADRLVRQHLQQQLASVKRRVDQLQQELVLAGNLNDLPAFERVVSALVALGNRMAGDVQGYSGFFDFVKIGNAQLDNIYEHDLALLKDVEELQQAANQLSANASDLRGAAAKLREQVDGINQDYDERTKILQGLTEE